MSSNHWNMIGGGFYHANSSSNGYTPEKVIWFKDKTAKISFHIDNGILTPPDTNKKNYAWLSESKTIISDLYNWCYDNVEYLEENFELIFTHDKKLSKMSDKIKLIICSAKNWVTDVGIHNKDKLISMISSNKKMCAEHRYRLEIINKFKNELDLYGNGFNPIRNKEVGLNNYYFSIAMENGTYSLMYSEKITDCFATGTIPIYYGSSDVGEVFNTDGIIQLTDNFKISDLSPELYYSKMDAIRENYAISINMPLAEDYIYETFIK